MSLHLSSLTFLAVAAGGCAALLDESAEAPVRASVLDASVQGIDGGTAQTGEPSLYPQVEAILNYGCSYERCHAGRVVGGGLSFAPDADFYPQLVGVRACEYDRMARVTPGKPEESWLWIKLTAPFRPLTDPYAHQIYFTPPTDWDASRRGCRDQTDEGVPLFGQRMPATAPNSLPDEELEVIRRWILQGAPR